MLAEIFRREQQRKGRLEGKQETDKEWEEWNTRKEIAKARGEPFHEPTPYERIRLEGLGKREVMLEKLVDALCEELSKLDGDHHCRFCDMMNLLDPEYCI